ncbi:helix-turn-helix domain-containing protein [Leptospira levettii]|uniref:helix-turn-helix transcriptional regulator n=1 Tax=Leptospira levettii TaxID=2023178 RepID=UPI00223DDB49|nr:helix-turn-helix transcriptional regulator [Leptospira levettii]MCW7498425.1 helix-turn-helix domain-containing protein [Leptospira levettii]
MDLNDYLEKIGQKVKRIRAERALTQESFDDLGEFSVPVRTLQEIEAGKSNFTIKTLYKISKKLKTKPKDLLDV